MSLAEWERRELETLRALAKNVAADPQLNELRDENQRLMAEIVLYRRLVSEHHATGALDKTPIGAPCPICAAFEQRVQENIWDVIIKG